MNTAVGTVPRYRKPVTGANRIRIIWELVHEMASDAIYGLRIAPDPAILWHGLVLDILPSRQLVVLVALNAISTR